MVAVERRFAGALVAAFVVAFGCGESVKPKDGARAGAGSPGDGGEPVDGGEGGTVAGDGIGAAGAGGVGGEPRAGSGGSLAGAGGDKGGSGGAGGALPAGNGGSVAGTETGGAGSGGVGGSAGTGGAGSGGAPVPDTLPTCITDLYADCWPEGACTLDEASGTRCYESGVRVVVEPVDGACFENNATTTYYKPDGSRCFEHVDAALTAQACETHIVTWADASGAVVADQTSHYSNPPQRKAYPTCSDTTATPCSGERCRYPTAEACTPGTCPPVDGSMD